MDETTKFILEKRELLGKTLNLFRRFKTINALTLTKQFHIDYLLAIKILESLKNTGQIKINSEGKFTPYY